MILTKIFQNTTVREFTFLVLVKFSEKKTYMDQGHDTCASMPLEHKHVSNIKYIYSINHLYLPMS